MTIATAAPDVFTTREKFEGGVHEVAIEHSEPSVHWTHHTAARDASTIAFQKKIATKYTPDERDEAEAKAIKSTVAGTKITVLRLGLNGFAEIIECVGAANDGKPTLLYKGSETRGNYIEGLGVAAVVAGHGKAQALIDDYNERAAAVSGRK
jgi:hypothetical protein